MFVLLLLFIWICFCERHIKNMHSFTYNRLDFCYSVFITQTVLTNTKMDDTWKTSIWVWDCSSKAESVYTILSFNIKTAYEIAKTDSPICIKFIFGLKNVFLMILILCHKIFRKNHACLIHREARFLLRKISWI